MMTCCEDHDQSPTRAVPSYADTIELGYRIDINKPTTPLDAMSRRHQNHHPIREVRTTQSDRKKSGSIPRNDSALRLPTILPDSPLTILQDMLTEQRLQVLRVKQPKLDLSSAPSAPAMAAVSAL